MENKQFKRTKGNNIKNIKLFNKIAMENKQFKNQKKTISKCKVIY